MPSGGSPARRRARSCCGPPAGARHGIDGQLFDVLAGELVPARTAVRRLLAELREDLRDHDEWSVVVELVERLFERGTSSSRQRRTWLSTGDWRQVAARIVREGTALESG